MIATLTGTLRAKTLDCAVVEVGGIGFKVVVPSPMLAVLGPVGDNVHLFTSLYVRQDHLALYGFATAEQLRLFELLLGVSGVGPKAATAILGAASTEALQAAIAQGNPEPFAQVHGIGKKTAARIVLELKGKLPTDWMASDLDKRDDCDVVAALTSLGYSAAEARAAVQSVAQNGSPLEERIAEALRFLAAR